jgi:hypothetical protein
MRQQFTQNQLRLRKKSTDEYLGIVDYPAAITGYANPDVFIIAKHIASMTA